MEHLSDVMRKRPWHPEMRRRYLIRTLVTCGAIVVVGSYLVYLEYTSLPLRAEDPLKTPKELLGSLRTQIENRDD